MDESEIPLTPEAAAENARVAAERIVERVTSLLAERHKVIEREKLRGLNTDESERLRAIELDLEQFGGQLESLTTKVSAWEEHAWSKRDLEAARSFRRTGEKLRATIDEIYKGH